MSDSFMYEFDDVAWDEFCQSDDHIVPHPGSEQPGDNFIPGDNHKKLRLEINRNTEDQSVASYVDQGREQGESLTLSKRKTTMMEKDSWGQPQSGVYNSASESGSIKEASSLASDTIRSSSNGTKNNNTDSNGSDLCMNDGILDDNSIAIDNNSFSYPLPDITHTGSNLDFFENNENKDSSDFLYYGWPDIGNFEDVDSMFRSCDSAFGLSASKEDEFWLSSADDIGESGNVLKPEFKFPCPEENVVDNIPEPNDSSKGNSINDSAITNGPIEHKEHSLAPETPDSYVSFLVGPATANNQDGFLHRDQGAGFNNIHPRIPTNSHLRAGGPVMANKQKKQFKKLNRSDVKSKEHYFGDGSFNHINNLPTGAMQLPGQSSHRAFPSVHRQQQQLAPGSDSYECLQDPMSYAHPDNNHLSEPASVNPVLYNVKAEPNGLTSLSSRESSHASSRLQSMESTHDPQIQASTSDPFSVGKFENHSDADGFNFAVPSELGSSNIQEIPKTGSGLEDISLEAASFRQLQLTMERLDLRTRLCIRDSLYRLARSAELRHNHGNLNGSRGKERDPGGAFVADGTNKSTTGFMDIETDTNPIDRSIAHLLFHRPMDSSAAPTSNPVLSTVHKAVATEPATVANSTNLAETTSEAEKLSNC